MKETALAGWSFALQRLDEPHLSGSTWRLILIDGRIDKGGNLVPGSGTGELISVYLDDPAVATLHEQSEGASKVVVPGLVPVSVSPRRSVANGG